MWFDTPNEGKEPLEAGGKFPEFTPGVHTLKIIDATYAPLKSGNGSGITMVTEGVSSARMWTVFNVDHTNPKARHASRAEFKNLLTALGIKDAFKTPEDACHAIQGKTFSGLIELDTYNGKTRPKLKEAIIPNTDDILF